MQKDTKGEKGEKYIYKKRIIATNFKLQETQLKIHLRVKDERQESEVSQEKETKRGRG